MIELLTCLWIGAYCLQEVPHPSADSSHHHWPEAGPSLLHSLHSCLQAVLHSHAPHTPHCVVRIGHALGHHSDASRHCCLCPTSLGHWHCTAPGKKEKKITFWIVNVYSRFKSTSNGENLLKNVLKWGLTIPNVRPDLFVPPRWWFL